jgi:DNA-binding PadR family transcriptional regulator
MQGDSYGYKINKAILEKTNHQYELKEATLYTAFKRLEQAGDISSYWGDETSGARRRYYTITNEGKRTYRRMKHDWQQAKKLIDILIMGEDQENG